MLCTEEHYFMQSDIWERNTVYFAVYSMHVSVIEGFRREVAENCAGLGYYAARSVFSYRHFPRGSWNQRMGPIVCPETSATDYHCSLRNNPEQCSCQYVHNFASCSYTFKILIDVRQVKALTSTLLHFVYFAYSYEKEKFITSLSVPDRQVQQITPTTQRSKYPPRLLTGKSLKFLECQVCREYMASQFTICERIAFLPTEIYEFGLPNL
jgi:hypothetical protein